MLLRVPTLLSFTRMRGAELTRARLSWFRARMTTSEGSKGISKIWVGQRHKPSRRLKLSAVATRAINRRGGRVRHPFRPLFDFRLPDPTCPPSSRHDRRLTGEA